jgi:hypothetical protein
MHRVPLGMHVASNIAARARFMAARVAAGEGSAYDPRR